MPHFEVQQLVEWSLVSMQHGQVSEDTLRALHVLLPDNLIVAALDSIDRGRVFKYTTSWGRSFFQVFGSTARYSVYTDLPSPTSIYCSCPSFSFGVLLADNQAMCKHVLAVLIARRLGKCVERVVSQDELVAIVCEDDHGETDVANE